MRSRERSRCLRGEPQRARRPEVDLPSFLQSGFDGALQTLARVPSGEVPVPRAKFQLREVDELLPLIRQPSRSNGLGMIALELGSRFVERPSPHEGRSQHPSSAVDPDRLRADRIREGDRPLEDAPRGPTHEELVEPEERERLDHETRIVEGLGAARAFRPCREPSARSPPIWPTQPIASSTRASSSTDISSPASSRTWARSRRTRSTSFQTRFDNSNRSPARSGPIGRGVDQALEHLARGSNVTGAEAIRRYAEQAGTDAPLVYGGSEPNGEVLQIGGRVRCASGERGTRREVEGGSDLFVWTPSGQGQVAGALLVVDDRAGEPPMGGTPFLGGSVGVDGRCEQGVREANGLVVQPRSRPTRPPRRDSSSRAPNAATPTARGRSSGAPPPQPARACPARLRTGTPGVNRAGSEGRRGSAKARPAPAGHRVPTMHARSPDRRRGCRHRPRGCEP